MAPSEIIMTDADSEPTGSVGRRHGAKRPLPPRLRRASPASLARATVIGFVSTVGTAVATALAAPLDSASATLVVAMIALLVSGRFASRVIVKPAEDEIGGGAIALLIASLCISTAAFIFTTNIERAFLGTIARDVDPQDARGARLASAFTFRDAFVALDRGTSAPIYGGGAKERPHQVDTTFVAPVISRAAPNAPVVVWAVTREAGRDAALALWRSPTVAGFHVAGSSVEDYASAVSAAVRQQGIVSVENPVFVSVADDVSSAPWPAWIELLRVLAVCAAAYVVAFVATLIGDRMIGSNTHRPRRR